MKLFALIAILFTIRSQAACPTPRTSLATWQNGGTVYYSWPTNAGPPPFAYTNLYIQDLGIANDITNAFNLWTSANQTNNNSRVRFSYGTPGTAGFRVYALRVNFPGDTINGDPHKAAIVNIGVLGGTNVVVSGLVTFYYGSLTSSTGIPFFNPNASNYHEFITKVMLHEIGHTFGLGDQPTYSLLPCLGQVPAESVMNGVCGTNDSAMNMPTSLQSCDNLSIY